MLEINNTTKQKINEAKTKKIVETWLLKNKKKNWEVSLAIVGSSRMKSLNNIYRGVDKTTDVLSFSEGMTISGVNLKSKEDNLRSLGEIIINIEEAKKANKYLEVFGEKKSADYIFYFLLIHGLLHLIGYEDDKEDERQKMILLGKKFLSNYF